jgi:hypothetical protein
MIRRLTLAVGAACLALLTLAGTLAQAASPEAAALVAQHAALGARLENSPFGRPLAADSTDEDDRLTGTIRGELDYPFEALAKRLASPDEWCAIVVLHLNVKGCRVERSEAGAFVTVYAGRKSYEPVQHAHATRYRFQVPAAKPDYMRVALAAPEGPLGTSDYALVLEATPIGERTFVALRYGFRTSVVSRLATTAYLVTAGAHKVGFTVVGYEDDGTPRWIDGMRGIVERNAMRNFLALDAYLATRDAPAAERPLRMLVRMAALSGRYPAQLREMTAEEYIATKQREWKDSAADA